MSAEFEQARAASMLPVGRVVIITGGGQGIGKVFAKSFAEAGAIPVIAEMNEENGEKVAAEIRATGRKAMAIRTDVSDENSVAAMARTVEAEYGRIDGLINNAGIFSNIKMMPFDQIPNDVWRKIIDVNLTGCFLTAKAVVGAMRRQGFGRIVNISSGAVTLGRPNYMHYTSSKAGLIGMTRSMARELGKDGITVNAILPGATFTEIPRETITEAGKAALIANQCIPRAQVPDDLVGAALFFSAAASGFVTGQCLTVDGGATHT